ncbi:MAG: hypothetical protein GY796_17510 [Chloroflexi bacterium]|nr:hypothetical protein [Chloroflexota bacterium]
MRKSEMTEDQLEERRFVLDKLIKADWSDMTVGDWFEKDFWAAIEASMNYDNGNVVLQVDYIAKNRTIDFKIGNYFGERILLTIFFQNKLREIVDTIISFQDEITTENYDEHLTEIVRVCPEGTFAFNDDSEDEDDRLIQLTIDE